MSEPSTSRSRVLGDFKGGMVTFLIEAAIVVAGLVLALLTSIIALQLA